MRRVAVTGASGPVGARLLALLDADDEVDHIVAIDARTPRVRSRKLVVRRVDLRSADLKPLFEGADVVIHLAFAADPVRDRDATARLNVDATRRVLDAAGDAGVGHVVCLSSAMTYGAWADNPVPITEDAPLRPVPGLAYAVQKAELERLVSEWRTDHPGTTATVLRPAALLRADDRSWLATVWRGLPPVRVRGERPPAQFVHDDDVAAAVLLAASRRLDGAYNLAPDGWLPGDEVRALTGGVRLALPERVARVALALWWRLRLGDVPPAALPYLVHPWVVANDRLRAAGWEPAHTNADALVAGHPVSRLRTWSTRHRQQLALAGAGTALAATAAGVIAVVRHRRRRARGSN